MRILTIALQSLIIVCNFAGACSGKRNVMAWRPSVCLSVPFFLPFIGRRHTLVVTHQGAARDAASVHFRPSISRTNILC